MTNHLTEQNILDLKILTDLIDQMEKAPFKIDTKPYIKKWFKGDFQLIRSVVKHKSVRLIN